MRAKSFDNLTGRIFGYWKVIKCLGYLGRKLGTTYECVCQCGTIKQIPRCNLISEKTKSCGCMKSSIIASKRTIHGHNIGRKPTKVYYAWSSMLTRCYNENNHCYKNYGARGITVCKEWENFETFLSDMGEPQEGYSLDRINVNGNYEKSNCRWASAKTQTRNRRNTKLNEDIVKKIISGEWSTEKVISETGCSKATVSMARCRKNWINE